MLDTITVFWAKYGSDLLKGTWDTLVMTGISTIFAYLIGLPLGVILTITQPNGIRPNRAVNQILGWIVNVGRSLPFIILMVAIMPFTKLIVGTKIGVKGAIVPLIVSAAPFIARMVETSLAEVESGVVEAAQSHGCLHVPDHLEGLSAGSQALPCAGWCHFHCHHSGLYRHGRLRGRRRTG